MQLGNLYQHASTEKIKWQQLYKNEKFHVMQLQIKKDELLKPHHATTDAFLVVVEGEINFNMHDENIHLHKGDVLSFEKYITHSVKAVEDSILLIVK
ncbi:MAG TPA: cupin domain-containing protein [Parafilimonas sp.]|nr:cupin domain-containing protein [Parafilimonas sp.]